MQNGVLEVKDKSLETEELMPEEEGYLDKRAIIPHEDALLGLETLHVGEQYPGQVLKADVVVDETVRERIRIDGERKQGDDERAAQGGHAAHETGGRQCAVILSAPPRPRTINIAAITE